MDASELATWLRTKLFGPFRIVLTDGATYDIYHPDQIYTLRTVMEVGVRRESSGLVEQMSILVALVHVVRLEPLSVPPYTSLDPVAG